MANKRAKTLTEQQRADLLERVQQNRMGLGKRDYVILCFSYFAGLRAAEIAGLQWEHVTDARGRIGRYVFIPSSLGKGKKERQVPMHPTLVEALKDFRAESLREGDGFHIVYGALKPVMTANNMATYLHRLYNRVGLEGCSSHSGRRTFITDLARRYERTAGTSLKDVQVLAGHSRIDTTERYIEPSDSVADLINQL